MVKKEHQSVQWWQELCVSIESAALRMVFFYAVGMLFTLRPEIALLWPLLLAQKADRWIRLRTRPGLSGSGSTLGVREVESLRVPPIALTFTRAIGVVSLLAAVWRTVVTLVCLIA
jgi:hypothetical protein